MKEMVGGCCVCSDERGWPENPLVYCDGQHCTVAVHQACYGIVTVPTGPWYCRKCESQERSARVRCELCPSRDGALKRTDTQSWAHVVCALYIPEVRFGNVTTMEPIILQLIPPERFSKVCYICQDAGKGSKASIGACMQCNKSGCKQQFHVTCAQALGLLCEEAGNYLDNVKYCGYCQHHYSKLKKGGNVKTIPPYKPVTHEVGSSDPSSSPEKESENPPSALGATSSSYNTSKVIVPSSSNASNAINQSQTMQSQSSSSSLSLSSSTSSSSLVISNSSNSKQRKSGTNSNNISNSSSSSGSNSSGISSAPSTSASSSLTNSLSSSTTLLQSSSLSSSSSKQLLNSQQMNNSIQNSSNLTSNTSLSGGNFIVGSTAGDQPNETSNGKEKSSSKSQNKVITSSKGSSKESRDKQKNGKNHNKESNNVNNEFDSGNDSTTSAIVSNANSSKENLNQKFTTSNFTESIIVNSDSVFGSGSGSSNSNSNNSVNNNSNSGTNSNNLTNNIDSKSLNVPSVKKRRIDSTKSTPSTSPHDDTNNRDIIRDVSVTLVPLPYDKTDSNDVKKVSKRNSSSTISLRPTHDLVFEQQSQQQQQQQQKSSEISSNTLQSSHLASSNGSSNDFRSGVESTSNVPTTSGVSLVVSVPLSTASISGVSLTNTNSGQHQTATIKSLNSDIHMSSSLRINPVINNQLTDKEAIGTIVQNRASPLTGKHLMIGEVNKSKAPFSDLQNSGSNSAPTITTMESGAGIKVTYDKQANILKHSLPMDDCRMTSTPDDNSNSFSDLKITFEAQNNSYEPPSTITPRTDIKDSPPSSPNSEIDGSKRNHLPSNETKVYHKVPHMLGNQLNPASSVAQKMTDQLYMELEAHSVYTSSSMDSGTPLVGPTFPGKHLNHGRSSTASSQSQGPSLSSMLGGTGTPTANGGTPQSLEQLLERQWEQGSQFLMEQAQHFDIASLLSCLHQLRSENVRLEDHVNNLIARRDHLLAVNARLSLPLSQIPQVSNPQQATFNNLHMNGSAEPSSRRSHHLK